MVRRGDSRNCHQTTSSSAAERLQLLQDPLAARLRRFVAVDRKFESCEQVLGTLERTPVFPTLHDVQEFCVAESGGE